MSKYIVSPKTAAIAMAATAQQNPFAMAALSAGNVIHLAVDFMYGTPERTRLTYGFACLLLSTAYGLSLFAHHLPAYCGI